MKKVFFKVSQLWESIKKPLDRVSQLWESIKKPLDKVSEVSESILWWLVFVGHIFFVNFIIYLGIHYLL